MKILITGGAGFIGSHLVEYYQGKCSEIRVLDNFRTGYQRNLAGLEISLIRGSVTDRDTVRRAVEGIDYIFHLAAFVSVPESMSNPHDCVDINVLGLLNVLEEAATAGVKKLVFASSAAVYGTSPLLPKTEIMKPEPASPYAITKLDGEHYLDLFRREGKLSTTSVRFFNVFGPRQDPSGGYAAAVPIFINQAINNQPIKIFGDGFQTRDFIYVKDIISALSFLALNESLTGVFNAGYGSQATIVDLANTIIQATGSDSKIVYHPKRVGDIDHSTASVDKLKAAGWRPEFTLAKGLDDTIEHFKLG